MPKPQGNPEALAESCIAKLAELDHDRIAPHRAQRIGQVQAMQYQLLRDLLKEAGYPVGKVKDAPLP